MATYTQARNAIDGEIRSGAAGSITAEDLNEVLQEIVDAAEDEATALAANYAPIASPALTGTPTAPTPATSNNSTRIATTAFVKAKIDETTPLWAPKASPALTGTPTAPTASPGTNTTQIATTEFVTTAVGSGVLTGLGYRPAYVSGAASLLAGEEGLAVHFLSRTAYINDYADLLSTSGRPSDILTVTRATQTSVRSRQGLLEKVAANAIGYHHAATVLTPRGARFFNAATNLALQSENFSTTWTTSGMLAFGAGSTVNAVAAPDGTTTADLVVPNTNNVSHQVIQTGIAADLSVPTTFSLWVKPAGYSRVLVRVVSDNGSTTSATFDVSNGTVTVAAAVTGTASSPSQSIEAWTNGWYRVAVTATVTGTTATLRLAVVDNSNASTFSGDGTSGLYLWGAQFEANALPTPYIATTSGSQTRAADSVSIATSAFPFSATQGTLVARGRTPVDTSGTQIIAALDDGSTSHRIRIELTSAGVMRALVAVGGVTVATLTAGTVAADTDFGIAFAWRANDFAVCLNGGTLVSSASGDLPTVTTFRVGNNHGGNSAFGLTLEWAFLSTRRHSNAGLQRLSR